MCSRTASQPRWPGRHVREAGLCPHPLSGVFDECLDVTCGACASGSSDLAPSFKDRHCRYRPDAEPFAEITEGVSVDLDDEVASRLPLCDLLDLRSHNSTRSAPRRPVVDYDRQGWAGDEPGEIA